MATQQPMTQAQAFAKAWELRKEKMTYDQIAEKLQAMGYVSKKSKEPVTGMTTRSWFDKWQLVDGQMVKITKKRKGESEGPVASSDFLEGLRELLNMDKIAPDMKKQMAIMLLKAHEGQGQS